MLEGHADRERWRRARQVFDAVVELSEHDARVRLDELCTDDRALRQEVASLLAHDRSAEDAIARLVAEAAREAAAGAELAAATETPTVIGRYRILAKLGEGGMGEVFLAEDTSLRRRVALKVPTAERSADPRMRRLLQQEARAAATLHNPHACVVHEVGESPAGRPFIAMEYIDGETLAARIRRGPLPAPEVCELGRQAAGALHDAHAGGVVHRDLKPSNIMLTPHGLKLLDFGLASLARDVALAGEGTYAGNFTGTIPYMSPEQVRSESVDHRTDLFSLGVVLYEAATGRLPFEGPTPGATCAAICLSEPVAPSRLVAELPGALDDVIARALAKDRAARYQDAMALGDDLAGCLRDGSAAVAVIEPPRRALAAGVPRLRVALALAAATAGIVGGFVAAGRPAGRPPPRAILLADFANATHDPSFDGTLRGALTVLLQQTPFLQLLPEAAAPETPRGSTRVPDARISDDRARAISRRRGTTVWISGAIASLGRGYALTLQAFDGEGGDRIATESVDAEDKLHVLPALGAVATRLRETLGESPQSIRQFNAPVAQATTASLDALQAYTLGVAQSGRGNYPVAALLHERAVRIDPEFAIAYHALAGEQLKSGASRDVVTTSAARAYELRGRATEQERLGIEFFYHQSVTGALDRSMAIGERWRAVYPLDWRSHYALAGLYHVTGQYENAVAAAREANRLNPDVAAIYSNLAESLFALDRYDEARQVYRHALARGFDAPEYHGVLWRIAYYSNDTGEMQRQLDWATASSTWALTLPSLSAALQGRWVAAQDASRRATASFELLQQRGLAALTARYEAITAALVGDCVTSRRRAAQSLDPAHPVEDRARAVLALALCGDTTRALAFQQGLRERHSHDTMLSRVWSPLISAAEALDRNRPAEAIAALEAAASYEGAAGSWPIYLRGLALLRSGNGAAARQEFQKIIEHRGRTLWLPFYPLAHLGLARAWTLDGDAVSARQSYRALFAAWKDADPALPVLIAARKEYERLPPR